MINHSNKKKKKKMKRFGEHRILHELFHRCLYRRLSRHDRERKLRYAACIEK